MNRLAAVRAWLGQHRIEVLGAGVAAAVVLGLRARSKTGPAGGGSGGSGDQAVQLGAGGAGSVDTTATDLWSQFEPVLEAQSRQIQGLSDQLGKVITPGPVATPPASSGGSGSSGASSAHYKPGQTGKIGRVGQSYSLRSIAALSLPAGASPTAVESQLRRIVAANPSLRGRSTVGGGTVIHFPR